MAKLPSWNICDLAVSDVQLGLLAVCYLDCTDALVAHSVAVDSFRITCERKGPSKLRAVDLVMLSPEMQGSFFVQTVLQTAGISAL